MKISACIPCYNSSRTIGEAIASVRAQSRPVDELFVVDNHSSDGSRECVASLGVRMIEQRENKGRGASRALAMETAAHELVLFCDSAIVLDPAFVENALPWFDDPNVAAVFGWVAQPPPQNAVERWRGRHLFKSPPASAGRRAMLATGGALLRASAVKAAGGFDPALIHCEDADLGARLLAAGRDMVLDPKLRLLSISQNNLPQVLERYWRWNSAPHGRIGAAAYLRQIVYSARVMALEDLRARDPAAALI
ncbi:MAG TPA: glycosyltransferase, partial [Chthoniobacteraceae bacterium]|nr:glycosyltransferase [Chthoniobacteraceae bacterium]